MFKRLIPQIIAILFMTSVAYANEQAVLQALSVKDAHGSHVSSLAELEELAGGKDQLIQILLKYRRSESPAFVAIRSENLLLNYADNSEVAGALEQDMNDARYFGLARTIASNIDKVNDSNARQRLAQAAIKRTRTEKRFESYGRMLKNSKDESVQRLAKDL